jgi:uncharacterized oligopeptide transporter (OPT) family protein
LRVITPDLKSGYLLGAHPRQQFLAQFCGIFVGTVVTVLTFAVLVPNAQVLGTDQFPAPAAQTWSAVAIALGQGLSSLESVKLWLIFAGGVVGVLTLAPVLLPKYQEYLPSAAGFGLAWVFHWYYGLCSSWVPWLRSYSRDGNRSSPKSSPCPWRRVWWREAR